MIDFLFALSSLCSCLGNSFHFKSIMVLLLRMILNDSFYRCVIINFNPIVEFVNEGLCMLCIVCQLFATHIIFPQLVTDY
jgi:hypothetical protein